MKKIFCFLIVSIPILLGAGDNFFAFARSDLRCSGKIIKPGDAQDYVLEKCGEPTTIEEREYKSATGFLQRNPMSHEEFHFIMREENVEVWTYNFGKNTFVRYLTFRNGRLIAIKTGGYGY